MTKAVYALLVVAAIGAAVALLMPGSGGPPSDEALIRNLAEHRAVFDRLIAMIREDKGLERVDDDWTLPDDPASIGVSPERIAEYRRLFAEAGLPRGFAAYGDRAAVNFIAYAEGLSVSGCAKGYLYSETAPDDLVAEPLDKYRGRASSSSAVTSRAIGISSTTRAERLLALI